LAISEEDIRLVIILLRRKIKEVDSEDPLRQEMQHALQTMNAWRVTGGSGPLPIARLRQWGVWPITPDMRTALKERSRKGTRPVSPPAADHNPQSESRRGSEEQAQSPEGPILKQPAEVSLTTEPKPGEHTPQTLADADTEPQSTTEPDPDEGLADELYDAIAQLDAGNYLPALESLENLATRARGNFRERITRSLQDAHVKLERHTQQLIEDAEKIAHNHPLNLDLQEEAWRLVLAGNPRAERGRIELNLLAQNRLRLDTEKQIEEIKAEARLAENALQLPKLAALVGRVTTLKNKVESGELSEELAPKVRKLDESVKSSQDKVRSQLGIASTVATQGEDGLREAYRLTRSYFDTGVEVMVDTAGHLGLANADVSTADFFEKISEMYISALRNLIDNRIGRAEGIKKSDPKTALPFLKNALNLSQEEVLTQADRRKLEGLRQQVNEKLLVVEENIQRYDLAKSKIDQARSESGLRAREQLSLLYEVRDDIYPDFPDLDIYIQQARDLLSDEIARQIEADITSATQQASRDLYEDAIKTLQDARSKAGEAKTGSLLAQALEKLEVENTRILQAQQIYLTMTQVVVSVKEAIQAYETDRTQVSKLALARELLLGLNELQRKHHQVIKVQASLSLLQGDPQNWDDGQRAYNQGDWAAAEKFLPRISSSFPEKGQATLLAQRAQAARLLEEALSAEARREWGKALDLYRTSVDLFNGAGTDALTASLAERARQNMERLRPMEQEDNEIRYILRTARTNLDAANVSHKKSTNPLSKVDPNPNFALAINALEKIRERPSLLVGEIAILLDEARETWREAVLDAMRTALDVKGDDILRRGLERAGELQAAGLLYEAADYLLLSKLQCAYLDQLYEKEINKPDQKDIKWTDIETNRRQRLRDANLDQRPEITQQLRDAMRQRIKAQVKTWKVSPWKRAST
jgi:hypothetical protein